VKSRLFALTTVLAGALVPTAHGTIRTQPSAHPLTTEPTPIREIRVTITDTRITVRPGAAPRGSYARFTVHNVGTRPHSFTLGKAKPGTGLQTGFSRTLKPKTHKILLLFLDYRGQLPYYSSLPADRSKPGMKGIFTIS
jgi:hypothetical protein